MAPIHSMVLVECSHAKEALKTAPQLLKVLIIPPPKPQELKQASYASKLRLGASSTSKLFSKSKDCPQGSSSKDASSSSHPSHRHEGSYPEGQFVLLALSVLQPFCKGPP